MISNMSSGTRFRGLIARFPVLGPFLVRIVRMMRSSVVVGAPRRLKLAWGYLGPTNRMAMSWAFRKTEEDNFLYPLDPMNLNDLTASVAAIFDRDVEKVREIVEEILADRQLSTHLSEGLGFEVGTKSALSIIGRRVVWYAVVRLTKPSLVVETGIHRGVGACVISLGLLRNGAEGFPGSYIGTEINPEYGALYSEPYCSAGAIVYGDSIETLESLKETIDLFINDSDHSSDYELREYQAIAGKLSPHAVVLGDNSHASPSLRDWSGEMKRPFIFLREKPDKHWYPGAGIGISLPSGK